MNCAWEALLSLLPGSLAREVDSLGRETLQELRLRQGMQPELNFGDRQLYLKKVTTQADLAFILNAASRYSPWQTQTMAEGFITAAGGHRIGFCGDAVVHEGKMRGIREPKSVCIRVARDYPGIGEACIPHKGSVLVIGPPGSGKTTLLRDICRQLAKKKITAVVDERQELFPEGFRRGKRMDVLSNCPKAAGVGIVLRTMGPDWIAVDEITEEADCDALIRAANCGVSLAATAHATSIMDLNTRTVYRKLQDRRIFTNIIVLKKDKSFYWERKETCS